MLEVVFVGFTPIRNDVPKVVDKTDIKCTNENNIRSSDRKPYR